MDIGAGFSYTEIEQIDTFSPESHTPAGEEKITMTQPVNPYVAGPPVQGGRGFFGRQDTLDWIVRGLRNPVTNSLVLFGQRRIGKTTLLLQLERTLPTDAFLPIYFDLQDQAARVHLADEHAHLGRGAAPGGIRDLDVQVTRRYQDPPESLVRFTGKDFAAPSLVISLTMKPGVNIVLLDKAVDGVIAKAKSTYLPPDIEVVRTSDQPAAVRPTTTATGSHRRPIATMPTTPSFPALRSCATTRTTTATRK